MTTHREIKMTRLKLIAIIVFAIVAAATLVFKDTPKVTAAADPDDAAKVYKAKCAACHGPKAAKFYDPAKPEDEQLQAILKGKKAAKPPHMPGFGDKGITEESAKALMEYMKTLKAPTAGS